jgi:predicted RNA-binding Zn ribbon-like protein
MGGVPTARQNEFQFDLTGGQPALDLANTISRRDHPEACAEHLANYADLVSFAIQDKILSKKQGNELRSFAEKNRSAASRSFRRAIILREAIYVVFAAAGRGMKAPKRELQIVNDYALEGLRQRYLAASNGGFRWEWETKGRNLLDRIIWPVAQAAADLLTSDQLKLVRWCEAPDCQWLFLDHSRNRSRRWCDMQSCGNRAKARRHYRRTVNGLTPSVTME